MKTEDLEDDLRPEYRLEDLGPLERGKHFAAYKKGANLVLLQPEVAAAFPTSEAVNQALLGLIEIARKLGPSRRPSRPSRAAARRPAEPR
jgi:hypothetical protein